jgi:ribonuclease P protein subunit POP4
VVSASNQDLLGIAGEVVSETTQMLGIDGGDRVRSVPKADATFAVTLPDGETVSVEGDVLVARPPRRTEQTGDSKWR